MGKALIRNRNNSLGPFWRIGDNKGRLPYFAFQRMAAP
jgi:hypothetical protein